MRGGIPFLFATIVNKGEHLTARLLREFVPLFQCFFLKTEQIFIPRVYSQ
jgi:hypothetical protein